MRKPAKSMGKAIRTTKRPSGQRAPRATPAQTDRTAAADVALLAIRARNLARGQGQGMLATLDRNGAPYASFAAVGWTAEGSPLFLLSTLADHTLNLARDPRASLLLTGRAAATPQATPRVSLGGRVEPVDDPEALNRYLVRHPEARAWSAFADFALYRMQVTACRAVLGFGDAHSLTGRQFLASPRRSRALAAHAADLLQCIIKDAALSACVMRAAEAAAPVTPEGASAGFLPALLDCDGLDLVHRTRGRGAMRLAFDRPAITPDDWLVAVQRKARPATPQR
jgi:putative heme iron utilization protein